MAVILPAPLLTTAIGSVSLLSRSSRSLSLCAGTSWTGHCHPAVDSYCPLRGGNPPLSAVVIAPGVVLVAKIISVDRVVLSSLCPHALSRALAAYSPSSVTVNGSDEDNWALFVFVLLADCCAVTRHDTARSTHLTDGDCCYNR